MNPLWLALLGLAVLLLAALSGLLDVLLRPLYRRLSDARWAKLTNKAERIRDHGQDEVGYRAAQFKAQKDWLTRQNTDDD